MNIQKLFKSLVVSGVLLGAGACGSTTSASGSDDAKRPTTQPDVDCSKVCQNWPGDEAMCPDPSQDGMINCCWLMASRHHVCCDRQM